MKTLRKIHDCIFVTQNDFNLSEIPYLRKKEQIEREKLDQKLQLIVKYLRENDEDEPLHMEIHKIIQQIEDGYKQKA